jgi:hypothetical protein
MHEFPWPRKIGCSEPSEGGEMCESTQLDVSYVQSHGGVSAGLPHSVMEALLPPRGSSLIADFELIIIPLLLRNAATLQPLVDA